MTLPSHFCEPEGGHSAGTALGARDLKVTATGGGFSTTVPDASGAMAACASVAFLVTVIFFLGRVRVTDALALDSGTLVLLRAIPGAATAVDPLPLWTTTTSISERVVVWVVASVLVTVAEPVMAVPWARVPVSTRISRVLEAPSARLPTEQLTFPEPADEQLVPEAA